MTSGKLTAYSKPQSPHLYNGPSNNSHLRKVFRALVEKQVCKEASTMGGGWKMSVFVINIFIHKAMPICLIGTFAVPFSVIEAAVKSLKDCV